MCHSLSFVTQKTKPVICVHCVYVYVCVCIGTTGDPKGVIMTHYNIMVAVNSFLDNDLAEIKNIKLPKHLSYMPLPHCYKHFTTFFFTFCMLFLKQK